MYAVIRCGWGWIINETFQQYTSAICKLYGGCMIVGWLSKVVEFTCIMVCSMKKPALHWEQGFISKNKEYHSHLLCTHDWFQTSRYWIYDGLIIWTFWGPVYLPIIMVRMCQGRWTSQWHPLPFIALSQNFDLIWFETLFHNVVHYTVIQCIR